MPRPPPIASILVAIALVLVVAMAAFYPRPSLRLDARTDRTTYAFGDAVGVSVVLSVGGNAPISITAECGRFVLGFLVVTDRGETIYNSLLATDPLEFCPARDGPPVILQPGWTESRSLGWNQSDDLGRPVPVDHAYVIVPVVGWGTPSVQPSTSVAQISVR